MKTSINFKAAKSDSEIHNFRKKSFDYIRKDLTPKNEYWMEQKIADRLLKIENYCKEKSGRKLQKNAMPVREAVLLIKENTTMQDLHNLSKRLEEELKIRVFQIAIHKDEGHYDKDTKEWKPNYHAHLVADWQDLQTGKTLKHQSFHYSKMQDLSSECLGMERGISKNGVKRLEAIEFKVQEKQKELEYLEKHNNELKVGISSEKFEELIVKENNSLGYPKINTVKTLINFKKLFEAQKFEIVKNKSELETKSKQIGELKNENSGLKTQLDLSQNKNIELLNDPNFFASEKKKYLDSVQATFEKAILFERHQNPNLEIADRIQLNYEISRIAQKISEDNNIPFSAFKEFLKDEEKIVRLFNLMHFGHLEGEREKEVTQNKSRIRR